MVPGMLCRQIINSYKIDYAGYTNTFFHEEGYKLNVLSQYGKLLKIKIAIISIDRRYKAYQIFFSIIQVMTAAWRFKAISGCNANKFHWKLGKDILSFLSPQRI